MDGDGEGALRLWPFKFEIRAVGPGEPGLTGSILSSWDEYYNTGGTSADVYRTGAVEFCAGILGRAFMAAETTPAMPGLDPLTLSMLVRQTVLLGNAVFRISNRRGRSGGVRLLPVVSYSVINRQCPAPETWRYASNSSAPTVTTRWT